MINGYRITQLVYVAAELGIADLLKEGPRPYEELAAACGANPQALYRLLRALCSAGVLTRSKEDLFGLTPLGEFLQTGSAGSQRAFALYSGTDVYSTWGSLLFSVQTGENAFKALHGINASEFREQHPKAAQVFNDTMAINAHQFGRAMVKAYNFSQFNRVVDVGGGQGILLMAILKAFPSVRGVLLEQSQAIREAKDLLGAAKVLDRCELVEGNFFEAVPAGGDAYLLLRIIHDWDDDHAIRLLTKCRQAMQAEQKILILERALDAENPELEATLTDLNMMVLLGGRERTDAQYEVLLKAAGFKLGQVIETDSPMHILEGVAVYPGLGRIFFVPDIGKRGVYLARFEQTLRKKLMVKMMVRFRQVQAAAFLLFVAAAAWAIIMLLQSQNMAPALSFPGFIGVWTVMMAAMMLPSFAPIASRYAHMLESKKKLGTLGVVIGYLGAWSFAGCLAYFLAQLINTLTSQSPGSVIPLAVSIFAIGGFYQFTPLKDRCLTKGRTPFAQLLDYASWKGRRRHLAVGFHQGAYCAGCCWSLMLLFAFGIMNTGMMVLVASVVAAEKLWMRGRWFSYGIGAI